MLIQRDGLEIRTSKMSNVATLEVGGAREAMAECKEIMMQVAAVLNAIIVENQVI